METPVLSVIVPTRNRKASILRLLRALAADDAAPPFEVIVADDGSTDDTVASLRGWSAQFPVIVESGSGRGPAEARNLAASRARGRLLLFFDDDVEPMAGTLAAHAAFHATHDNAVGIGDLPPAIADRSFFGIILRGWWEMMLREIRRPGHRFEFRNVLTGHLSITRARFEQLGGFDAALQCHEDWEFGYRALRAGLDLRFVAGAVARHHETSDLNKVLRRKFEEGIADIQLTRRYPELTRVFPFAWPLASRRSRLIKRLTMTMPAAAAVVADGLAALLPLYERLKLRFRWRQTLELLLVHHYWRGVRNVATRQEVLALIRATTPPPAPPLVLDLADGLEAVATALDRLRPESLTLMLGGEEIGRVWPWPGLEPLRGAHLPPLLARAFRRSLLRTLDSRGALPHLLPDKRRALADARDLHRAVAPLVWDVELPSQVAARLDVQHRATVPPIHHVA